MQGYLILPLMLLFSLLKPLHAQTTEFSQENAYDILKILVNDIGPRPMGSPAEQRALDYAVTKFAEYGCQQSFVLPFTSATGINTRSGIAVGRLQGKTNRIIVIGGHIDSSGPDVPGANDDGSGSACVIELARVLGTRQLESTIVFACFGGEEAGLQGSKFFVENFAEIDSVVLMLQLDMTDGAGILIADPSAHKIKAPRWLTSAAFDVFYNELGFSGLTFLTHESTINTATGGFTGSDHIPFLEKGIPAIDFTSDVTYPIHTPQDNLDNFDQAGLKRSGDLALKLVERFDAGVPAETNEQYMLLQFGSRLLYLDYWMLWLFVGLSSIVAIFVFVKTRRARVTGAAAKDVKWSGFKIFLFVLFVQTFVWNAELIVGLMKGYRFPWVNNFSGFVFLGIVFGLLAFWFVLQMVRRFRLTPHAYPYFLRASLMLGLITIFASFANVELAVYPAWALLFFSLAMLAKSSHTKLVLFLVAPYPILKLIFFESLGLFQRGLTQNTTDTFLLQVLYNIMFVIVFSAFTFPFAYAFAAIYRDAKSDILWLRNFREKPGLVIVSFACVALIVYLSLRPVYNKTWYSKVTVDQSYELGSDSSTVRIRGSESLDGVVMNLDGTVHNLEGRSVSPDILPARQQVVPWFRYSANDSLISSESADDSSVVLERVIRTISDPRPYRLEISYSSADSFEVDSPWHIAGPTFGRRFGSSNEKVKRLVWTAYPDAQLFIPVEIVGRRGQEITEKIEVTYDTLATPIKMEREFTNFFYRTVVASKTMLTLDGNSSNVAKVDGRAEEIRSVKFAP